MSAEEHARGTTRRKFMKILGGGTILAAVGAGGFSLTRTPTKALAPWNAEQNLNVYQDARHYVLAHAVLAPNPHNRQPWLVELQEADKMTLYCDLDRRLPVTDPYDRQITVGLGCFLELANIAANQIGYRLDVTYFPQGESVPRLDEKPVAELSLVKDESIKPDLLFRSIFERRSNKEPFDTQRPVSSFDAAAITGAATSGVETGFELDEMQIAEFRELTRNAIETELRTPPAYKESVDLFRIGKAEVEANPDGIDLSGMFFEVMKLAGQMNKETLLDPDGFAFAQGLEIVRPQMETAMGYVRIVTKDNSRVDQINAGRSYIRMNLKATETGISMQPLSQALQEYPEVAPYYNKIRKMLGLQGSETLQMFARIGYGEKLPPSPRWDYRTRIRNA